MSPRHPLLAFAFSFVSLSFAHVAHAQPDAPAAPPPVAEPTPAPVAAPPPTPAPADVCPADWKKRVYMAARDSVVTVEPIGFSFSSFFALGGFVYPSRSHVVALSDAIGVGRGVRVTFAGGQVMHARAVAVDHESRLTILALDAEAPAPALEVSDRPLEVGEQIATILPFEGRSVANPDETALDALLQVGHVANAGDRTVLRFDGGFAPAKGAPVFACDGKLVAMREWDELIAGSKIRALRPAASPIDDKSWSLAHLHLGMLVQGDRDRAWIGLGTGMSLVYADRLQLRLGLGVLAGIPRKEEQLPDESRNMARIQAEPTIGWRFLLSESFPMYIVPQIGAVGRADFTTVATSAYSASDPACFAAGRGPCPVDRRTDRRRDSSLSIAPVFGASFLFAITGVSYQLQLDPEEPRRSTHQVFVGIEF